MPRDVGHLAVKIHVVYPKWRRDYLQLCADIRLDPREATRFVLAHSKWRIEGGPWQRFDELAPPPYATERAELDAWRGVGLPRKESKS